MQPRAKMLHLGFDSSSYLISVHTVQRLGEKLQLQKTMNQKEERRSEGELTSPAESLPRTVDSGAPGGCWSGPPKWSPKEKKKKCFNWLQGKE